MTTYKANASEQAISKQLAREIRNGNKDAESEMIKRYSSTLLLILKGKSNHVSLAEDIAQDTWILVLKKLRNGELRDEGKLKPFISQIGKNLLLMHYRSKKESYFDQELYEYKLLDKTISAENLVDSRRHAMNIWQSMLALKIDRDRDILTEFYLKGSNKKALCEKHSLEAAHFDRVMYRARNRLKQSYQMFC